MKKISTLFKKDPNNLALVINKINSENEWALIEGIPTRKYDGTACAIIQGEIYKRYDVKAGKQIPENAIPCQEPDKVTGHWPHWVKCERNKPEDKYYFEAFDNLHFKSEGTYELCGPKINGNPEKCNSHELIKHGVTVIELKERTFEYIKEYLSDPSNDIEGIVFHNSDGRMCKIKKSNFGIKR
jgi:hypothetical protein